MKGPNITTIFVAVAAVGGIAIAGGVVLTVFGQSTTEFYAFVTSILVSIIGFGGLARSQGKVSEALDEVNVKVNGKMSRLLDVALQRSITEAEKEEVARIGVDSGVIPTTREQAKALREVSDNG